MGLVRLEQRQGLLVREVPVAAPDALLEKRRVGALLQHLLVVVGLQKSGMALAEVVGEGLAGLTNISKHAHLGGPVGNDKTVRVGRVVALGKRPHAQPTNPDRLVGRQRMNGKPALG